MQKLTDQLREAIDHSGMSRYAIAKAIGLDQATISRFMAGKGGLGLETVDKLAAMLHLRLETGRKLDNRKGR
jgi:DNA transposition AAA+ family ATPase